MALTNETKINFPGGNADDQTTVSEFGRKKKTKPKNRHLKARLELDLTDNSGSPNENRDVSEDPASDDVISYDQMLNRMYQAMKEDDRAVSTEKRQFKVSQPQVLRHSMRTAFINFTDIAKELRRPRKHVMDFISAECGSNCVLNKGNQLLISGKFQPKHIEQLMRSYIKQYVLCPACRLTDTYLDHEVRLHFLNCNQCGACKTVPVIAHGYRANTGRP